MSSLGIIAKALQPHAARMIHLQFFVSWLSLLMPLALPAQLEVTLAVENQVISGQDFYFDIYLVRTSANPDNIYLAGSDFVLNYDHTNFNSPSLESVNGFCSFGPSDGSGSNTTITQSNYESSTSVSLISDMVVINLDGPSPDATTINTRVAMINQNMQWHRLGRFKISGLIDPGQGAGLQWKIGGMGLTTIIASFQTQAPFNAQPLNLITGVIELCQSSRTVDNSPIQDGKYQADSSVTSTGTIPSGNSVMFAAGNEVSLLPNFSLEIGALFEIHMDGCDP